MNILSVIVAYNPEVDLLRKNISAFYPYVQKVLIWRNSPVDEKVIAEGFDPAKIEFCGEGVNKGLPKPLNFAWRKAKEGGFTHLLTMDQDSVWEGFQTYIDKISSPDAPYGIYGPSAWEELSFEGSFVPTEMMITSGMLIPVDVLEKVGGWSEDFFLDAVDTDFVYKCRAAGINAYIVSDCFLHQKFGNVQHVKFLKWNIGVMNYGPERLYGIFKNHRIIIDRYPDTRELKKRYRRMLRRRIPRILIAEKEPIRKVCAILRGVRDGRRHLPDKVE